MQAENNRMLTFWKAWNLNLHTNIYFYNYVYIFPFRVILSIFGDSAT